MEFVASLPFLFGERPWADQLQQARQAGFDAVEVIQPGIAGWPADQESVADGINQAGLTAALTYLESGDLLAGERGFPNEPDRRAEWRAALDEALVFAARLSCPMVGVLAGTWTDTAPRRRQRRCLFENLRWAAARARATGVQLVVENLNDIDYPTYLLPRAVDVVELLEEINEPSLRMQFDVYHCAMVGDDPVEQVKEVAAAHIGYVQLADSPGRHEPGTGKIGFDDVLKALNGVGYRGMVGLEFVPTPAANVADVVTSLRAHAGW